MSAIYRAFVERTIDRKKYSTDTAEYVCRIVHVSGGIFDEFHAERTDLYRTKKGRWFIAGEGGACTRWATLQLDGRSWGAGKGLQLVTPDEARKFMEDVGGPVEDYFDIEEG